MSASLSPKTREAVAALDATLADLALAVDALEADRRLADASVLLGHYEKLRAVWLRLDAGEDLDPSRASTGGAA